MGTALGVHDPPALPVPVLTLQRRQPCQRLLHRLRHLFLLLIRRQGLEHNRRHIRVGGISTEGKTSIGQAAGEKVLYILFPYIGRVPTAVQSYQGIGWTIHPWVVTSS